MYYSRSNLAYDFTIFEEDERPRTKAKGERAENSAKSGDGDGLKQKSSKSYGSADKKSSGIRRIKRRKTNFVRVGAVVAFGLALVFVVVAIIHGQVQLTEINQEIAEAKSQLAEQQSVYTQLKMKVDSSVSNSAVEEYVKENLNMSKAENSQKEFVNLSDGDKAEVSLSSDKNIFESIAEAFASLWS